MICDCENYGNFVVGERWCTRNNFVAEYHWVKFTTSTTAYQQLPAATPCRHRSLSCGNTPLPFVASPTLREI